MPIDRRRFNALVKRAKELVLVNDAPARRELEAMLVELDRDGDTADRAEFHACVTKAEWPADRAAAQRHPLEYPTWDRTFPPDVRP